MALHRKKGFLAVELTSALALLKKLGREPRIRLAARSYGRRHARQGPREAEARKLETPSTRNLTVSERELARQEAACRKTRRFEGPNRNVHGRHPPLRFNQLCI